MFLFKTALYHFLSNLFILRKQCEKYIACTLSLKHQLLVPGGAALLYYQQTKHKNTCLDINHGDKSNVCLCFFNIKEASPD